MPSPHRSQNIFGTISPEFEGTSLKDKYGLVEGEGSKVRTMRIHSSDFNKQALTDYVKQTLENEKQGS